MMGLTKFRSDVTLLTMQEPQFLIHNTHLEDPNHFGEKDPQLRTLKKQTYVYQPELVKQLPLKTPGIYSLAGGRQIGKTTLAKQWMQYLLQQNIPPKAIAYFTGEIIVDHMSLIRQLQSYIQTMPTKTLLYLIIDEVTYIRDWDMGIKFLADAGLLENVILLITGSDLIILQEAKMRFPGRRGKASQVDFHIHPLSFYEALKLTSNIEDLDQQLQQTPTHDITTALEDAFVQYLQHGGYLTAINDFAANNKIHSFVLDTYTDWIRGDLIKRGKNDHHCKEFLFAMLKRLNSQITWNALAKDISIDHHQTIANYANLLMSMDAIYIQQALQEDKLAGALKKAKKLIFTDPFIYHAVQAWLYPTQDPFNTHIIETINNPKRISYLVESCLVSHYRRWYPTYYIKSEGEVDIAYIKNQTFWPVEIKWAQQIRPKDLKQIQKYPNGIILAKQQQIHSINNTPCYPLPWYLAKLGMQQCSSVIHK